ncbi:MAG: prepilin-type N-terminal cleavage/methylation domain-containing protein [Gemmatimonadales bacterium]
MMYRTAGFTITEVLVAIIILAIGILALAGGSTAATKMLSQAERSTWAAAVASARIETLRRVANRTVPRCTDAAFASGTATTRGVSEAWTVPSTGTARVVLEVVTYVKFRGTISDSIATIIGCGT